MIVISTFFILHSLFHHYSRGDIGAHVFRTERAGSVWRQGEIALAGARDSRTIFHKPGVGDIATRIPARIRIINAGQLRARGRLRGIHDAIIGVFFHGVGGGVFIAPNLFMDRGVVGAGIFFHAANHASGDAVLCGAIDGVDGIGGLGTPS